MEAPGEHDSIALALANSRRTVPRSTIDDLETVQALEQWLSLHGLGSGSPTLTAADLERLRDLRDTVRELLGARVEDRLPSHQSVISINDAAMTAPAAPQLDWDEPARPTVTERPQRAGTFAGVLAAIARDTIDLITGERHHQLRMCDAPDCIRFMLAEHPRRRWCSKRCGDRIRAARHYERKRNQPL